MRDGKQFLEFRECSEKRKAIPRVIVYHQTHYHNGELMSVLPLLTHKTGVTHVIIAAVHLNQPAGNITLNDDPYQAPKYDALWQEVCLLQDAGVKVLGMLGGAHAGSFTALDGDLKSFDAYYEPLRQLIEWTGVDGLDLDVEEAMSLAGMIRLIDRLKEDFGPGFLITLAPIATAMINQQNLSGFSYESLEKAFGQKIAWYNVQFYCGWGRVEDTADYDGIIGRGWDASKIVMGLVTNPETCKGWGSDDVLRGTLRKLMEKYPSFGGVMGWEYFNSITSTVPYGMPWCWALLMTEILEQPTSRLGG
ncbi:MAG: hypothetical protein M1827_005262 [Pycnora praestabilis]|nr:MAG: hypothetical protein M1827_005262 [Pycnora praestabilis]